MPNEKIQKRQERQQIAIVEALKNNASITGACRSAGISRCTFYRWMEEEEFARRYEEADAEAVGVMNDVAESGLKKLVKEGHRTAIMDWLKHHHPGYKNGAYDRRRQAREEKPRIQEGSHAQTLEDRAYEETIKEFEDRLLLRITGEELPPLSPWPRVKGGTSEKDAREHPS